MDFSEAKSLYVGNTPVGYAWLNGRRVWPQGVGNDEVGLLLTDGTYVPYAEVVKGTRAIGKDEVVGITFNDELNSFIMAPENVGPFYFCGANILPELPEGMPPENLTGPQVVTNADYRHGKEYTDILYPYLSGAPEWAVPQAKNYVFKDGTPGYLGSPYEYKQIQRHYEEINEMAAKVGLDELFPGDFSHRYWTSVLSEFHEDTRWVWIWSGPSYVDGGNGQGMFHIRPLGEFKMSPSYELDPSLIDAWIFSGLRNEDAPASIVGEKGIELQCYNFAWNEEGSGFKDGALYFDGVDDYLAGQLNYKFTEFTIIMRRQVMKLASVCDVLNKGKVFILERTSWSTQTFSFTSFGEDTVKYPYNDDGMDNIIWMTPTKFHNSAPYVGYIDLTRGTFVDDGNSDLRVNNPYSTGSFHRFKLEWFAIYSRSLTEPEIQSEIEKLEALWNSRLNNNNKETSK